MASGTLDLDAIVDGQKFGGRSLVFFATAMLALIGDGYNLSVMGFIFPELSKLWGLTPGQFVPASQSAYIIGMFFGAPLLGFLGDRYGRKRVAIGGLIGFGLFILATMAVGSVPQLVVVLFLTGLGLGGMIPNVIALVAEIAPRRVRGRVLVVITMGMVIGIALPGVISATLVPRFGWRVLLLIGGLLPIAVAGVGAGGVVDGGQ